MKIDKNFLLCALRLAIADWYKMRPQLSIEEVQWYGDTAVSYPYEGLTLLYVWTEFKINGSVQTIHKVSVMDHNVWIRRDLDGAMRFPLHMDGLDGFGDDIVERLLTPRPLFGTVGAVLKHKAELLRGASIEVVTVRLEDDEG